MMSYRKKESETGEKRARRDGSLSEFTPVRVRQMKRCHDVEYEFRFERDREFTSDAERSDSEERGDEVTSLLRRERGTNEICDAERL